MRTTTSNASSGPSSPPAPPTASTRGPAGERLEREGLDDRPHQPGGLAGPGRADGQQRGAQQRGFQGEARAAPGVRVVRVVGAAAEPDLAGQQVVPGGAVRQVAGARGVERGGAPGAQDGLGERGEALRVRPADGPGVAEPGDVDVVHAAGAHLGGEGLGGVRQPRGTELGPLLGAGGVRGRGGGVGRGPAALFPSRSASRARQRPRRANGQSTPSAISA